MKLGRTNEKINKYVMKLKKSRESLVRSLNIKEGQAEMGRNRDQEEEKKQQRTKRKEFATKSKDRTASSSPVSSSRGQRTESALLLLLAMILQLVGATIQSLWNKDAVFEASMITFIDYLRPKSACGRYVKPPGSADDYPRPISECDHYPREYEVGSRRGSTVSQIPGVCGQLPPTKEQVQPLPKAPSKCG